MRLIVKVDLIGHSKMDLVLSLLVGLNSRYVKGPLLGYTFISHSNCWSYSHWVMNYFITVVIDE
jgi:hypothetical protein